MGVKKIIKKVETKVWVKTIELEKNPFRTNLKKYKKRPITRVPVMTNGRTEKMFSQFFITPTFFIPHFFFYPHFFSTFLMNLFIYPHIFLPPFFFYHHFFSTFLFFIPPFFCFYIHFFLLALKVGLAKVRPARIFETRTALFCDS